MKTILFEKKAGVGIITLHRPEKLNASNTTMYKELVRVLTMIEADKEIMAVIITGSGDKAFSAGADLHELDFDGLSESSEYIRVYTAVYRNLENISKPVIAAVNGLAVGFGCKVAFISDIVVAARTAKFAVPAAGFGAVDFVSLGRARGVMGRNRLGHMLLTGEMLDAEKARDFGIVTTLVESEALMGEAMRVARKVAACPAEAIRVIRRMMHRGHDDDYRWEDLFSPRLLLMKNVKEAGRSLKKR